MNREVATSSVMVEEEKVPAHRNVLATCSDYFHTMFTIGMQEAYQKEVELFGVTCLGFKAILDFLYGGDLFLDSRNVDTILETAPLLQIWKVVDFCCEYLENEIDKENYLYLQEVASIFNLKRLDSFIDVFIMKNFITHLTSMRQQCADFHLGAIRDMLVAVGGRNENRTLSSVEIYSPEKNTWSYVASLPRFIYGHGGAIHEELVYISGGHDYQAGLFLKNLLCYDYRTDTWEERRPMITAQGFHSMSTLQNDIYAIRGSDNYLDMTRFDILEVESYSPKCNQWTRVVPLLQANSKSAMATWDGKIYILGGYSCKNTNNFSKAVQVYDKTSKQWQKARNLPKAITYVLACVCVLRPKPQCHEDQGR